MRRFLLLILAVLLVGCGANDAETPTPSGPSYSLLISGSGGTTPVLAAIAPAFTARHSNYHINTLQGSSTSGGINALQERLIDVAAMGRAASPDELETMTYVRVGMASEVPVVNPSTGVTDLTGEELRAVFSGEIDNWSLLGGADIPIQVFVRSETSIHTLAMRDVVFGDIEFTQRVTIANGMGDMLDLVANTRGAIGYAAYPTVLATQANVTIVAFDGVDPLAISYPGLLEIGLSYLPERESEIAPLVEWLKSEEGKAELQRLRVVP